MYPILRQSVRDYLVSEQFHRDVFIKGPRRLATWEQIELVRAQPFVLTTRAEEGEFVLSGESVATVKVGGQEVPVCTAFQGWLMGFLVLDGQPIRTGEPVAWLRMA